MSSALKEAKHRRKGQPILVLGGVLLLWCGARLVLWQSPFPMIELGTEIPALLADAGAPLMPGPESINRKGGLTLDGSSPRSVRVARSGLVPFAFTGPSQSVSAGPDVRSFATPPVLSMFESHQLPWMPVPSAVPTMPKIAQGVNRLQPNSLIQEAQGRDSIEPARWSFDSWVFVRPGSIGVSPLGASAPTYGASQAGAVLRYRLAPNDRRKPSAYLRVTRALVGAKEADIALGLSARPLAKVPLTAHAEVRASHRPNTTGFRPAAFLVTELPPKELPMGLRVAAYGQAGYVGGEFATPFSDGQARLDREVVDFKLAKLRAGVGAWGGAQRGAARLDVGPTASVDVKIGKAPARLSIDYRYRVAGDAEPQSGVAITLSTGF